MAEIIDYSSLDREIMEIPTDLKYIKWTKKRKKKETINSISELRQIVEKFVLYARDYATPQVEFKNKEFIKEFVTNQLVFDILYDKYASESEMTLHKYCTTHICSRNKSIEEKAKKKMADEVDSTRMTKEDAYEFYLKNYYKPELAVAKSSIYNNMRREIENLSKTVTKSALIEGVMKQIIDIDEYIEYMEEKENPKFIWDDIWYRNNLPVLKSISRSLYGNNEDDNKKLVNELKSYDDFVREAFIPKEGDNKDYFHKSMGFYHLESICKVEFTYKLAKRMEQKRINSIDGIDFCIVYNPLEYVIRPYMEKGSKSSLRFNQKLNIYPPCIMRLSPLIEDIPMNDNIYINSIRAQACELFKYYYRFESDNYEDMSKFIRRDYNILDKYYEKNKIWKDIKENAPLTSEQRRRIKKIQKINSIMIWQFANMSKLLNHDREDEFGLLRDEDYERLLGMNRETYKKNIGILESESKKLQIKGGKSQLSVRDKLLITIEYNRHIRTMDEIAKDYGVSKSTISEVNKRVSEILKKESEVDNKF